VNIKAGFKASGINPFNRGVFKDKEYKFLRLTLLIDLPLLGLHQLLAATVNLQRCLFVLQYQYHPLKK
jgi:hypothetical protein